MTFSLSEKFENFEICRTTGIEEDIIVACFNFCLYHIKDFDKTQAFDDMKYYLDEDIAPDEIAYFTFEMLENYMNDYAPIGTYFGSHEGDGSLGFWRLLEYDQIGYDYAECEPLAYKNSGYDIFRKDDNVQDKLSKINFFLDTHYKNEYNYTDLAEVISELTIDLELSSRDMNFAEKVIESVISEIIPLITPNGMTWRLDKTDCFYGIYPELPDYVIENNAGKKETVYRLFDLMVFVAENNQAEKLIKPGIIKELSKSEALQQLRELSLEIVKKRSPYSILRMS